MKRTEKITELFIEERQQLQYCGHITFNFCTSNQFTFESASIKVRDCPSYTVCIQYLKERMKKYINDNRPKNFKAIRTGKGW